MLRYEYIANAYHLPLTITNRSLFSNLQHLFSE